MLQVFVESLDRAFQNVCELDLVFQFDEVHHILSEVIQGGLVLETSVDEIDNAGKLTSVIIPRCDLTCCQFVLRRRQGRSHSLLQILSRSALVQEVAEQARIRYKHL
jgi:hypothetical protein